MPYLVFNSKEEAIERNDQAGADKELAYHTGDGVTRYVWRMLKEAGSNRAALEFKEGDTRLLTTEEEVELLNDLPDDWQFPAD